MQSAASLCSALGSPLADTSFMYMIAGLCMLKLYQKRHPDINASAYSAYACLAVVIFFSVVGVVSEPRQIPRHPNLMLPEGH